MNGVYIAVGIWSHVCRNRRTTVPYRLVTRKPREKVRPVIQRVSGRLSPLPIAPPKPETADDAFVATFEPGENILVYLRWQLTTY